MIPFGNMIGKSVLCVTLGVLCFAQEATAEKIDAYYFDLSDPFTYSLAQAVKDETAKRGTEVIEHDASFNADKQLSQVLATETGSPKLVNIVDPKLTAAIIEKARNNSARLVFFNRPIESRLLKEYDQAFFVYNDSAECGRMQAHLIAKYISKHHDIDKDGDGVIKTVLVRGEANNRDAFLRSSNVLNALAERMINVDKVAEFSADWVAEKAYNQMLGVIADLGLDEIELIICNNDAMALGVISALQQHGYNAGYNQDNYIPVFGVDAVPEALKAVSDGTLAGTILNDAQTTARVAVALALEQENNSARIKEREKLKIDDDGVIYVPYKMITRID